MQQNPFPAYWIFRDDRGRWSWKFAGADGNFIAASSTHYRSQQECARAIQLMRQATSAAIFGTLDDVGSASLAPEPEVAGDTSGGTDPAIDESLWAGTLVDVIPKRL